MSKILIFSDIHIYSHKRKIERLNDCLNCLEWIFQTAKKQDINDIVFCGDLFHERQKIDVLTYQKTFETFIKHVSEERRIHLLLGNHDMWYHQRRDVSSIIPFSSIPGVNVISKPCSQVIAGHSLSFLPYTHDPAEDIKKIPDRNILFGHVAIDGAVWNTKHNTKSQVHVEHDGDMTKVDAGVFKGFNQVFLGHYHAEQKLAHNVEYVGSPLQLSFGEAFQHKHIIILDLEDNHKEYIRNGFSPQHLIVEQSELEKCDLEGNFVQVMVEDTSAPEVLDVRNKLSKVVSSLEIKPIKKAAEEDALVITDAKEIISDEGKMIERYLDELDKSDSLTMDRSKLIEIGNEICSL